MDRELKGQGIPFDPIDSDEDLPQPSPKAATPSAEADSGAKKKKSSGSPLVPALLTIFLLFALSGAGYLYYLNTQEKEKRVQAEKMVEQIEQEKDEMQEEIDALSVAKNQLEIDLKRERDNYSMLRSQYQQQEAENASLMEKYSGKMKEIASLKSRLAREEKESQKVASKIDRMEQEYDEVKRQLSQIRMAKEALENKLLQLNRDKEAKSSVELERIVVKGDPAPTQRQVAAATVSTPTPAATAGYTPLPPPGRIEGQVLVVNREFAFVVVNVGQKDGLKEEEMLHVFRGTQEIGQVQVERVYDTMSSAVITSSMTTDIQEGDIVRVM